MAVFQRVAFPGAWWPCRPPQKWHKALNREHFIIVSIRNLGLEFPRKIESLDVLPDQSPSWKKKCNIWSVGAQTGNQLIWREKHWATIPSMLGTRKNKMSKSLLKAHLVDLVSALHSYLAGICITQPFTPRLIFGGWSEHFYEQFFWHLSVHNEPPLNFLMYIQTKLVIQIQLVCLWSGSESALSALFLWSMLPISSGMMGCLETPHLCALWLVLGSEMAGCWAHFLAQKSQQTVE